MTHHNTAQNEFIVTSLVEKWCEEKLLFLMRQEEKKTLSRIT